MTALANFPQAPRNRLVELTGELTFPRIEPLSLWAIRTRAVEELLSGAIASSAASIEALGKTLVVRSGSVGGKVHSAFRDELDSYMDIETSDIASMVAKVRSEFAVFTRVIERPLTFQSLTFNAFLDVILDVHRRLGTGANSWRQGPVGVCPGPAGNRVLYPHHRYCLPLLARLHAFLMEHAVAFPLTSACVAFASILHAHPFDDGNGRTARTMFNLVLGSAKPTRHFLPIHFFASIYRPGFIIKLRRADRGDWQPLQMFLAEACRLSLSAPESFND